MATDYVPQTVYPTRARAFPAATFFSAKAKFDYIRAIQADYHGQGVFGICVCPARSFWMLQVDVHPAHG